MTFLIGDRSHLCIEASGNRSNDSPTRTISRPRAFAILAPTFSVTPAIRDRRICPGLYWLPCFQPR